MTTAIIEIPQGSFYKYEIDKMSGFLTLNLDRVLVQPYPYNYGYLPGTLSQDGDPLDVFILSDHPIHPLTKVKFDLIGVLRCTDNGVEDDKILATIKGDPFPELSKYEIIRFLETYKTGFVVNSVGDAEEAQKVIDASVENYTSKTLWALEDGIIT